MVAGEGQEEEVVLTLDEGATSEWEGKGGDDALCPTPSHARCRPTKLRLPLLLVMLERL